MPPAVVDALGSFGLSSICNVLAAIKTARYLDLGEDDVILTIATDGAELYETEWAKVERTRFGGRFDLVNAGEVFAQHLLGASTDHVLELGARDRARIFNLGYYTWVEQQGVSIEEFTARRDQRFWIGLRSHLSVWDDLDPRVQPPRGRGLLTGRNRGDASLDLRVPRLRRRRAAALTRSAARTPAGEDDVDHVLRRTLDAARVRAPTLRRDEPLPALSAAAPFVPRGREPRAVRLRLRRRSSRASTAPSRTWTGAASSRRRAGRRTRSPPASASATAGSG